MSAPPDAASMSMMDAGTPVTPAEDAGADAQAPAGCTSDELACDGACVANDSHNCGRCGHDCTALAHVSGKVDCNAGTCVFADEACADGWKHCSGAPDDGCETDATQPAHCGACDSVCPADKPICAEGACESGCPASSPTLCGTSCANTQTDPLHCKDCETSCTTNVAHALPACTAGNCDFACAGSYTRCGNACVDTSSDVNNCNACDRKCSSGVAHAIDSCSDSKCGFSCTGIYFECSGKCVDRLTDNSNCGSCGNICTGGKTCQSGVCKCSSTQHDCNGSCVSKTSVNSCGTRCSPCPAGNKYETTTCDGTSCGLSCTTHVTCFGQCTDTSTDLNNCGGCGIQCSGFSPCVNGGCQ